ncbi:hypothetical protein LB558_20880 [Mesorhizobium sp. CO1-1-8]|nr:hypothetical protein [Mesorhizobium sp. CO1-1-8]
MHLPSSNFAIASKFRPRCSICELSILKLSALTASPAHWAHEGGYSNNKKDPDGPTMKGVTQRVYDAIAGAKGQAARSVKSLATVELNHIYDKQNWDAVKRRSAARRCRLCRL